MPFAGATGKRDAMGPSWPKPPPAGVKSHSPPYLIRIASASGANFSQPVIRSASPSTTTSNPSFHAFVPVVTATAVEAARFCAFCSSGPVQNTKPSSTHAPMSGVTCGWPSLRTVVSQYNSAAAGSSQPCCHTIGSDASLKRASNLPVIVIPIPTVMPRKTDQKVAPLNLSTVSKSPLRRLSESLLLASMRPALTEQALRRRRAPVDLNGKRVLLTGASAGIGEPAAEKFARRGAQVVVVARRQELLDSVVERITQAGGNARSHATDLSDLDAVDELIAKVEQDVGGVDILINNAGRSIRRPLHVVPPVPRLGGA